MQLFQSMLKIYKREFVIWVLSIVALAGSILFLGLEIKRFSSLTKSKTLMEGSLSKAQAEVSRLRNFLETVDWQKSYHKNTYTIETELSLLHLPTALEELKELTPLNNTYCIINEMVFQQKENSPPTLKIRGEMVVFQ